MKGNRRGGRPPEPNKRCKQIAVRLTADQYDRLRRQAGRRTVSALVRERALGERSRVAISVPEINQSAWIELARTAANINQLTHHANQGLPPEWGQILEELSTLAAEIAALRSTLIGGSDGNW